MIKEDYVSFEVAKLLQEKGFDDSNCQHAYDRDGKIEKYFDAYNDYLFIGMPTLQMAMKWLREVHHYYIQVMIDNWVGAHCGYYVIIMKTDSDFGLQLYDEEEQVFYETPEKASEAAIKYCLENLI